MSADRRPEELLAAYVDGVGELAPEERRRVEAWLDADPAARTDAEATRALLGQLRELPPEGEAPDWSALERAIGEAVGPDVPRPWWRRWTSRWVLPGIALAATAAFALVWALRADPAPSQLALPGPRDAAVDEPDPVERVADDEVAAVYLDGADLDLRELDEAELELTLFEPDDVEAAELATAPSPGPELSLDELDAASLDELELLLDGDNG